ncbi:VOC family protein [Microbacterium sp.]|jgi:PhnB protein|uniref:VOC family protein n=1 Tax=Microbacterium sp. TaxID=51671 RepID=UPI0035B4D4C0
MARLNPYISFDGNAREAMEYYRTVFGGTLQMDTFEEFPMDGMTDDQLQLIMHAQLETPAGFTLMGADTLPGMPFEAGARITISLSGASSDEVALRGCWDALARHGTVTMPLETAPWGAAFGGLVDRYGVQWFVNIGDATQR